MKRAFFWGSKYWSKHLAVLLEQQMKETVADSCGVRGFPANILKLLRADSVILVGMPVGLRGMKQLVLHLQILFLEQLMRKSIVHYWIGSDVTKIVSAYRNEGINTFFFQFMQRRKHMAGAPWFVRELKSIGIVAQDVLFPTPKPVDLSDLQLPTEFKVLTYIPDGKEELYGLHMVQEIAHIYSQVPFLVMGGRGANVKAAPDNIQFLGYVKNTDLLYRDITVVLRLVAHDAVGATVREALNYGRFVLYTLSFPQTIFVETKDDIIRELDSLLMKHNTGSLKINQEAIEYSLKNFDPEESLEKMNNICFNTNTSQARL